MGRPEASRQSYNQRAAFTVSRQKLQIPPRLAQPKARPSTDAGQEPVEPPDPFAGFERVGTFIILGRDALGKRALARCTACATVREISVAGDVPSCGCSGARRSAGEETFASAVAAASAFAARHRHRSGKS